MPTRHFLMISLLAFVSCFFLTGCETGEPGVTTSQSRGSNLASGAPGGGGSVPQFSSIAAVSFLPPSDTPRGQTIRAQADQGFGRWRQLIGNVTDNLPLNYSPEEVSAEGHPVFYTPTVSPDGATMGGVWDVLGYVTGPFEPGDSIEYTWTLPPDDSELPTLLFFNQPGSEGFLGEMIGQESDYQVVTGDTIVLRLEQNSNGSWSASINGQALPGDASNLVGIGEISQPVFYSRRHGTHTVTTVVNSSEPYHFPGSPGNSGPSKTLSYFQKGLVFTEPFPQTDPENPQEPLTIENHVEWSDGSPLTDEEVKWQVAETGTVKSGTGKDILAIWNPIDRTLTRADEGEDEEQEVEDFEDLTLSVSARTQVYEEKEEQSLPSFPYVIRQDLDALGAREFRIIGAEVLPEEPFTEEEPFAEFNAEICLIGPDPVDYDVTWVVEIKNPEGEIVVPELQMGEGYQVYAFWDGTVGGELVEEPETYQFHVRVEACESDGGGAASRAIRTQETTTPECLGEVAKLDEPIGASLSLEVFSVDEDLLPIGSSQDDPSNPSSIAFARLTTVTKSQPWKIVAQGVEFSGDTQPEQLTVSLQELTTDGKEPTVRKTGVATLSRVDDTDQYEVDIYDFLSDSATTLVQGATEPNTTYSIFDPRDVKAARDLMKSAIDAIPDLGLGESTSFLTYQRPLSQLGEFVVIPEAGPIELHQAFATQNNLREQGFAAVKMTLSSELNPGLLGETELVVKVARPVSLLLSIADGFDDSKLDVYDQPSFLTRMAPDFLSAEETSTLRTWILASCRVLDLYDLNNNRTSPDVALGSRPAPGKAWWRQYCQGRSGTGSRTLLGYNHPTLAIYVVQAMENYGPELQRLTGELSAQEREQLEIYAWLSANRKAGKKLAGCYAGCAWDEKYYYYLAIDVPIYPVETADSKSERDDLGFFRIPITDGDGGNSSISPSPTGIPDGAEQVFIPGWDDEVVE